MSLKKIHILISFFLFVGIITFTLNAQFNKRTDLHIITAIDRKTPSKTLDMNLLNKVRIPNAIITNKGTLFVTANTVEIDGKLSNGLISRSINNGQTWCVFPFEHKMPKGFLYDKKNDAIFFLNHVRAWRSTDDGKTFEEYSRVSVNNPLDSLFNVIRETEKQEALSEISKGRKVQRFAYELTFAANPCLGIQLTNGVLVMPFKASIRKWKAVDGKLDNNGYPIIDRSKVKNIIDILADVCVLVYSKDYGKTWEQSPSTKIFNNDGTPCIIDEVSIAEVEENRIMINARGGTESWINQSTLGRRVLYQTNESSGISKEQYSIDGFEFDSISDGVLWDPLVHAAFAKCEFKGKTFWLFSNCYIPGGYRPRKNILLQVSADGHHWTKVIFLTPKDKVLNGYCCINSNNNKIIFCYEDTLGIRLIDLTSECIDEILEAYEQNIQQYNIQIKAKKPIKN